MDIHLYAINQPFNSLGYPLEKIDICSNGSWSGYPFLGYPLEEIVIHSSGWSYMFKDIKILAWFPSQNNFVASLSVFLSGHVTKFVYK